MPVRVGERLQRQGRGADGSVHDPQLILPGAGVPPEDVCGSIEVEVAPGGPNGERPIDEGDGVVRARRGARDDRVGAYGARGRGDRREGHRRVEAGGGVAVDEAAVAGGQGRQGGAVQLALVVGRDGQRRLRHRDGAVDVRDGVVGVRGAAGGDRVCSGAAGGRRRGGEGRGGGEGGRRVAGGETGGGGGEGGDGGPGH